MNNIHCASFNPRDYANCTSKKRRIPSVSENCVMKLFEKKFNFIKDTGWILPCHETLFKDDVYEVPSLQILKSRLNYCKSKLNDNPITEWAQHTRRRNPAGDIPWKMRTEMDGEFVTQAFCKFYECLCSYSLVDPACKNFKSLHLCEAPGAFVTALNHYLKLNTCDVDVSLTFLKFFVHFAFLHFILVLIY